MLPEDILILFPNADPPETDARKVVPVIVPESIPEPEPAPVSTPPRRFCVRCGKPCDSEQRLCADCRKKTADSPFAAPAANKKKPAPRWGIIVLILLLLIGIGTAVCLIWNGLTRDGDSDSRSPGVSSTVDGHEDEEEVRDSTEEQTETSGEASENASEPSEESTDAPTEPPTEAPTEPPVVTYTSVYEVIADDVSWQEAQRECEARGGTLATITSLEEYNRICAYAENSGLTYLWLGACIYSDADEWGTGTWVTGEAWSFEKWYPGEPSKQDDDGTKEYYLCMWNAKYDGNEIGWTFNDQRNDIVGSFPAFSGKIGYICEYKVEVTQ